LTDPNHAQSPEFITGPAKCNIQLKEVKLGIAGVNKERILPDIRHKPFGL